MEITLIKHNLKKDSYRNIIIIISTILAIGNLNIITLSQKDNELNLSQIFISIFGGISYDITFEEQMILLLQWLFPHILILYLLNVYISNRLIDDMLIILPRIKNKIKWIISLHSSIFLLTIKYYFIMFFTYIVVSYIFIGEMIYLNTDYRVILSIVMLSILMSISVNILLINCNLIFGENTITGIIVIILLLISNFIKFSDEFIFKNIFINNSMIIRHSGFYNIKNFNIQYSIVYFVIFMVVNFIINFLLVSKLEIKKLKIF